MNLDRLSLDLLVRALDQTGELVSGIRRDQAVAATPCSDFDVRALVNHLVMDLLQFSNMLAGKPREPPRDVIGDDWSGAYRSAAYGLLSTWGTVGTDGTLKLAFGEFPKKWAIGQDLADVVVHGWDIAQCTGQTLTYDDETAEVALEWARENLKPEYRGQAFGAEVAVKDDAPAVDRLAAFFGRDPAWHRD